MKYRTSVRTGILAVAIAGSAAGAPAVRADVITLDVSATMSPNFRRRLLGGGLYARRR
jgi:hypothetical protein